MRSSSFIVPASLVVLALFAAATPASASNDPTANGVLVPQHVSLMLSPPAHPDVSGPHSLTGFSSGDGAGIAGVNAEAGGFSPTGFVHLEDPTVCTGCTANALADDGQYVICPPAGDVAWPWHWSTGATTQGNAGCAASLLASTFVLNTNGYIVAGGLASCTGKVCATPPTTIPGTANPNGAVYANWQDLDMSCAVAPNGLYLASGGTVGTRYMIVEWLNVKTYPCATSTSTQTFEIILFEEDNSALVYYGASTGTGLRAIGGEENGGGTAGLTYFNTASVPQNDGIAWFDYLAPTITSGSMTCTTPGNNGWCKSSSNSIKITDNNDVGLGGRIGMGVRWRNYSIDAGAQTAYVNNTAQNVNLADGTHAIAANTTDWGLNSGTGSISVKIDTTAPTFDPKSDVVAEATSASGAAVNYQPPTINDATSGGDATSVSCSPASGSTFAMGTTTVSCTGSDLAGNSGSGTFRVIVRDTTAPAIDAHANVVVEATSAAGATGTYMSPAAHDLVSGDSTASCSPASGAQFALGTTTISCSASDAAGNTGSSSFSMIVRDTTPPTVDTRSDVTSEATSASGATVNFAAPASHDLVDGDQTSSCSPASGSQFALGSTTVSCSRTDAAGNTGAPSTFAVRVLDTTPPTIDGHAAVSAEATSSSGAPVTYTSPATHDAVDGDGTATCAPASGSTFALGTSTVTCSASDAHENAATPTTFQVTVRDTTAPTIDAHADVAVEASSLTGGMAFYTSPSTHDLVDADGVATCAPASGSNFLLGDTTVTCNAVDAHGNAATATHFNVHVSLTVRFSLRMEHGFYDVRNSLQGGVHATVTVTTGDGTPIPNVDVALVVTRIVPVIGALDNATLVETTGADGTATFTMPIQFGLPGDYSVAARSITSGLAGDASASYSVGVTSNVIVAAPAPRKA